MSQFIDINAAARLLNVCTKTLKRWEAAGKITSHRTPGGHRRYDTEQLMRQALIRPHHSPSS